MRRLQTQGAETIMITLELFCGTKSFSKVANELGHETFTVDIDPKLNPDLVCDILDFKVDMLPEKFRTPDIVWASPPCTTFSVASIRHYWKEGKPKNDKCLHGIAIAKKTVELIKEINPKYYFIENPRGMMRKQDFMQELPRNTVTYCQYGLTYQKATDIWTNCKEWVPKPKCSPNSPCHVRSPRGSRTGTQGIIYRRNVLHPMFESEIDRKGSSALARGVIPPALFFEIFGAIK